MILVGYTHGLRVSELTGQQWSDVSFEDATPHIRRAKGRRYRLTSVAGR